MTGHVKAAASLPHSKRLAIFSRRTVYVTPLV
jgi:hypothetical protein